VSDGKHSTAYMIGEALREMGLLAIVFIPIDAIYSDRAPSFWKLVLVFCAGLVSLLTGVVIERVRK
jgi:hypothetical protein